MRAPRGDVERVDRARAAADVAEAALRSPRRRRRRASTAASRSGKPSASSAARVELWVQPEPCAAPSGWIGPGIASGSPPSSSRSAPSACPPVTITAAGPERADRRGELDRRHVARRLRAIARASGRFGVSTLASGSNRPISASRAPSSSSSRRSRRPSPGRSTTGTVADGAEGLATTAVDRRDVAEHADLDRVDPDVVDDGLDLGDDDLGRDRVDRIDADRVLGRDRGDRAWSRGRRRAAKAFRSAWIPAPPPESEPAIDSTTGVRRLLHATIVDNGSLRAPGRSPRRAPGWSGPSARRGRRGRSRRARARRARSEPPRTRARPPPRPHPRVAAPDSTAASTAAPSAVSGGPQTGDGDRAGAEQQVEHVRASRITAAPSASSLFVPPRAPRGDRPGHGADLPAALDRHLGGDQRSRALRRLDDHRDPGERRHQPVARRKHPAEGRRAGRQLRDRPAPLRADPLVEVARASADRRARRRDRAPRRCGRRRRAHPRGRRSRLPSARPLITITPLRGQRAGRARGDLAAVGAGPPGADDRDRALGLQARRAATASPTPKSARGRGGAERRATPAARPRAGRRSSSRPTRAARRERRLARPSRATAASRAPPSAGATAAARPGRRRARAGPAPARPTRPRPTGRCAPASVASSSSAAQSTSGRQGAHSRPRRRRESASSTWSASTDSRAVEVGAGAGDLEHPVPTPPAEPVIAVAGDQRRPRAARRDRRARRSRARSSTRSIRPSPSRSRCARGRRGPGPPPSPNPRRGRRPSAAARRLLDARGRCRSDRPARR